MPLRRTYACLSLDTPVNLHDSSALSVPSTPSPTSESAFRLGQFQPEVGKPIVKLPSTSSRFHDITSAPSVPSVHASLPSPTAALQPKVGKPIVKLPNTSSRFRSSLLGPCQSLLRVHRQYGQYYSRQSSHLDLQIFLHLKRHFKPGLNLYRHVLSHEFLRAVEPRRLPWIMWKRPPHVTMMIKD